MTLALDVNLLAYASDGASPFQERAEQAINGLAQGNESVYIFWPVVLGYLRISTNAQAFRTPLAFDRALGNIDRLLALPHFRSGSERDGFLAVLEEVSSETPLRGNLISDAHIVALMRQHGISTIWTHDRDFRKFDGIRIVDPFA